MTFCAPAGTPETPPTVTVIEPPAGTRPVRTPLPERVSTTRAGLIGTNAVVAEVVGVAVATCPAGRSAADALTGNPTRPATAIRTAAKHAP